MTPEELREQFHLGDVCTFGGSPTRFVVTAVDPVTFSPEGTPAARAVTIAVRAKAELAKRREQHE